MPRTETPRPAGPVEPDPARRPPARALTALWAASAVGGFAQSLAGAAGALLAREVAGSDAVAGLPQAMLVIGSAVAAFTLSAATLRWGRGRALASGSVAAAVGCGAVVVSVPFDSLAGVLAGTLVIGAGNTAVLLARYAAADLAPEAGRARAMATVLVATTIGAVAGPNMLASTAAVARQVGLPGLTGPYLLAGVSFVAAAVAFRHRGADVRPAPEPVGGPLADGAVAAPATPPREPGRAAAPGAIVLAVANLVMVAVMTMAPVHLAHSGVGLGLIGVVISLHIAGMFAPSPLAGWLTDRIGARPTAGAGGAVLALAGVLAGVGADVTWVLVLGLVLLGIGWNLAFVAGSALLTAGVEPRLRPRREAWGEVGMGVAAAGGGAASGVVMAGADYGALALAGAAVAVLVVLPTLRPVVIPGRSGRHRRPLGTPGASPVAGSGPRGATRVGGTSSR